MFIHNAQRPPPPAPRLTSTSLKVAAGFLVLSAGLYSCQKDDSSVPNESSIAQIDVTPRVRAFVERARSSSNRDGDISITLDSAEWYIEAALNLTVAQAWIACNDQSLDSLEFTLPVEAGSVTSDDASEAYLATYDQISEMITPQENHLIVADVMFLSESDGSLVAKVLLQFGAGYDKTYDLVTSYGTNDYWYYGSGMGPFGDDPTCGCGSNNNATGACADLQIKQRITNTIPGLNYPCYYTNVESRGVNWGYGGSISVHYTHTDFPTGIPATPYKIYYCQGGSCDICLSPSKMSFYTQGEYDIMQQIKPAGKTSVSVNIEDFSTACGLNCTKYLHSALYTYGTLTCPRQ